MTNQFKFTKEKMILSKTCIASNEEISEKLLPILYDYLIDLANFRYDLMTHKYVTCAVLLAKEYNLDEVLLIVKDIDKLKECYHYLNDLYEKSHEIIIDHYDQARAYHCWHDDSRYVTDYLNEEMQPNVILNKLLKLYDYMKENENNIPDNTIFTKESELFLEDYLD